MQSKQIYDAFRGIYLYIEDKNKKNTLSVCLKLGRPRVYGHVVDTDFNVLSISINPWTR